MSGGGYRDARWLLRGLATTAQSALSQQVLKLEAELGVRLLHRGARAVELTEAGTVVLERAHRLAADADALVAEVDALRGLVRGRMTIGGVPPIGGVQAARIIASFARRHPAIEVRVREDAAPRLIEELRRGALDVVLALVDVGSVPGDVDQADDIQTVLEMVLEGLGCTVLPRDSPRPGRRSVRCRRGNRPSRPRCSGARGGRDRRPHPPSVSTSSTRSARPSQVDS